MAHGAKHPGHKQLTLLVGLWIAAMWIGSDMYLPALPGMDEVFATSEGIVNVTLLSYNIMLPVGALIGGPLSDKLGRRNPTLVGAAMTVVFNIGCAFSPSIYALIAFRALAGLGAGVITATAMAILRDSLEGEELETSLTLTQSLAIVGPIVAPFLGSLMLAIASWQAIFVLLAAVAALCTVWYLLVCDETYPPERRRDMSVGRSLAEIIEVGREAPFTLLLIALGLAPAAFGVFMTVCSYVYIDFFALDNLGYSLFYGLTCVAEITGPFIYNALRKRIRSIAIIWISIVLLLCAGTLLLGLGRISPLLFFVGCIPFVIAEAMNRPCMFVVLLTDEAERAGAVSALISFVVGLMTALGTPLASLGIWGGDHIVAMGGSTLLLGILSTAVFAVLVWPLRTRAAKYLGPRRG